MRNIETHIIIQASLEDVWKTLTDFQNYPNWSPTIKSFSNIPQIGKHTKVVLTQPNGFKIKMNPIFLKLNQNQEMSWKGSLFVKGIFDGEHYFKLRQVSEKQIEFIQGENFSGILVPFLKKMIDDDTKRGMELFNKALKNKVEKE